MSQPYSFWNLLKEYRITIPIIQRDYAQGRVDKYNFRLKFLRDIKYAFEHGRYLYLDFVFGVDETESNGVKKLLPLDGQQRLTTLWLIHWYLSFVTGTIKIHKEVLLKFSYQTRVSSSDFCGALCENADYSSFKKGDYKSIAEYITDQTWFLSNWNFDPTVNSMLRTISGNNRKMGKDSIEGVFGKEDCILLLEHFTGPFGIVKFQLLHIGNDGLPLPDNQYIMMNSRGKELTTFERFKSDLIEWMESQYDLCIDQKGFDIASNIDNEWSDLIWNEKKNKAGFNHEIDNELHELINNFLLVETCASTVLIDVNTSAFDKSKSRKKCTEKQMEMLEAFDKLYDYQNINLSDEPFSDLYEHLLTVEIVINMNDFFVKLNNPLFFSFITTCITEARWKDNSIIPLGEINNYNRMQISSRQRVYLYALIKVVENISINNVIEIDIKKVTGVLRVIGHIIENADFSTVDQMVEAIRKLNVAFFDNDNLSKNGWDVYSILASTNIQNNKENSALERQWKEECEKARYIENGKYVIIPTPEHDEKECRINEIREAEDYAFFNGSIRFLYRDENNNIDWIHFKEKWKHVHNHYFTDKSDDLVPINTIKSLLNEFCSFEELVVESKKSSDTSFHFTRKGINGDKWSWKKDILWAEWGFKEDAYKGTNPNLLKPIRQAINDFLLGKSNPHPNNAEYSDVLINSTTLSDICNEGDSYLYYIKNEDPTKLEIDYIKSGNTKKCIIIRRDKSYDETKAENDLFKRMLKQNDIDSFKELRFSGAYLWGKRLIFRINNIKYAWMRKANTPYKIYSVDKDDNPDNKEVFDSVKDFIDKKSLVLAP